MTATPAAPQATAINLRAIAAAIVTWMKGHIVSVITAAVVGTLVGFIANVWLLAFVYEGYEKVPPGGPAPGLNNEVIGTLFWLLISTVVFGTYGYYRAVGPARFAETLRTRPAMVSALFSGGGNAALAALLWGAMISLLVTVVVGPAIGAVLGVGIFATAFGFIGRLITIAAMRVVTAILKIVQPSRTAKPSPAAVTAGIVGGSLAMVVGFILPSDPYSGPVSLRLILAIGCGLVALVLSRPTSPAGPVAIILIGVGGLVLYDLLHPLVVFALDGGSLECGGLGVTDYILQPCPGKETVTVLSGVGGAAAGLGAGPGMAAGNILGTNPNWGPGITSDEVRGGKPGEELPGKPGDEDYTETITDAQGNVQRTVEHKSDPVTGDVTVTTRNSQGTVINTITTHVDPITGDTTINRTSSQGNPVVGQVTHTDPITGETTVTVTNAQGTPVRTTTSRTDPITGDTTTSVANPQGTPIRTSHTHDDPVTGDQTVTVTNSQGNPTRTFTTHQDPITGDVTRSVLNPQNNPIRTVIDHADPVSGDVTRTTLNPQGNPITTQRWHEDPITGDTTHTVLNPQGTPIRTEIEHTDPTTGDTTRTVLNPQDQPIRTEIEHTDPITGDTTRTVLNPQDQPIRTEIEHKDPITGDVTKTTLNPQNQPIRTDVWHEDPITGDEVHSSFNPQGQPIGTVIYHTDPITGDTSVTVLNEQGQVEHTYTVHKDPITGLWVPDTSTGTGADAGSSIGAGAAAVGSGIGSGAAGVGSGIGSTSGAGAGTAAGPAGGPTAGAPGGTGAGPGSGGPAVQPSATAGTGGSPSGQGGTPAQPPGTNAGTPSTGGAPTDDDGGPDPVEDFFDDMNPDDSLEEGLINGPPPKSPDSSGVAGESSSTTEPAPAEQKTEPAPATPTDPVLDQLASVEPTTVGESEAFPVLHALVPEVGADGKVAGISLGQPEISGGKVTVPTPFGPATASLGIDDKGHLTAKIIDMPKDPTEMILPNKEEATQNVQQTLDAYNNLLDQKGVHLTDVQAEGGKLTFIKAPNATPPTP